MTTRTFFLKDIREENYPQGLSAEEKAALDRYLEEMAHGPADGEMDIDWKSEGQGYYIHEHILHGIKDEQERDLFLQSFWRHPSGWFPLFEPH